jgi:hypothetical protein
MYVHIDEFSYVNEYLHLYCVSKKNTSANPGTNPVRRQQKQKPENYGIKRRARDGPQKQGVKEQNPRSPRHQHDTPADINRILQ